MDKNRTIVFYLLMLVGHIAHVFEEVWGRFWLLEAVFGLGWFLIINWMLYCIPIIFFYFVLCEKRWGHQMGILYAGFMGIQGIGHNVATLITGTYFGGFAGGLTGIALTCISIPLIYYLLKTMPSKQSE